MLLGLRTDGRTDERTDGQRAGFCSVSGESETGWTFSRTVSPPRELNCNFCVAYRRKLSHNERGKIACSNYLYRIGGSRYIPYFDFSLSLCRFRFHALTNRHRHFVLIEPMYVRLLESMKIVSSSTTINSCLASLVLLNRSCYRVVALRSPLAASLILHSRIQSHQRALVIFCIFFFLQYRCVRIYPKRFVIDR